MTERCGDCGLPLSELNRWTVPGVSYFVCDKCGGDRQWIRWRLQGTPPSPDVTLPVRPELRWAPRL